jgi:hypothetical protein
MRESAMLQLRITRKERWSFKWGDIEDCNTKGSKVMDCRIAIFAASSRGARPPSGAPPRALAGRLTRTSPCRSRGATDGTRGGRAPRDRTLPRHFPKVQKLSAFGIRPKIEPLRDEAGDVKVQKQKNPPSCEAGRVGEIRNQGLLTSCGDAGTS